MNMNDKPILTIMKNDEGMLVISIDNIVAWEVSEELMNNLRQELDDCLAGDLFESVAPVILKAMKQIDSCGNGPYIHPLVCCENPKDDEAAADEVK
jgi:hypothetical protein